MKKKYKCPTVAIETLDASQLLSDSVPVDKTGETGEQNAKATYFTDLEGEEDTEY